MIKKTCCFTGHRLLPQKKIQPICIRLNEEIEKLIEAGVDTFISGGALGFDQMAGALIASIKEMGTRPNIKLIMVLPCRDQEKLWTDKQKEEYGYLLESADEVVYISEQYIHDCMKKRNYYMVEHSAFCICALLKNNSGTGQTVRYAESKNLNIINVAF